MITQQRLIKSLLWAVSSRLFSRVAKSHHKMSSQNNSRVEADRCNDGVMIPMAGLFSPFLKHSLISMCALTSATFHLFYRLHWLLKTSRIWPERKQLGWFPMPSRSARAQRRYIVLEESRVYFTFLINTYSITVYLIISSPAVLLHFLLGKREKLPGCFPHVAKHTVGQGKALLHLPAVTFYTVQSPNYRHLPMWE